MDMESSERGGYETHQMPILSSDFVELTKAVSTSTGEFQRREVDGWMIRGLTRY
jgi:hypothetical protein